MNTAMMWCQAVPPAPFGPNVLTPGWTMFIACALQAGWRRDCGYELVHVSTSVVTCHCLDVVLLATGCDSFCCESPLDHQVDCKHHWAVARGCISSDFYVACTHSSESL